MSDEERQDSLADQAAAWIPPWERPTARQQPAPAPTGPDGEADTAPPADPGAPPTEAVSAGPTAQTGPGAAGEPAVPGAPAEPAVPGAPAEPATTDGTGAGGVGAVGAGVGSGPDAAAAGERDPVGVPKRRPAGRRRVTVTPPPAPELDDAELRGALEAILLVVDEPVSELVLAQVLEQSPERIGPVLDDIAAGYTAAGHGFELRRAAGGWRLYTRPEYAAHVERFVLDGQSVRLTQAALETLAVIAYKQPVTRGRVSAIRGVNCDGVLRTLVSRGLVEECGAEPDSGAFLYRTTTMFLEKLGLDSVADLPPLAPFLPDDVEELADATR
ncbi:MULTISPECIES: SMC-Scp complex subunit ScpB [unclassified Micromonospora]|uniref:SMC-Scp complex subunit ScpB n=1 Tax=unclassified Micromonospora TaxID=2617518 RepID=UPI001C5DC1DA|nr:SMC-Scp complex subunit ScpB [Micromonospora sp. RL09-050-HVF-A]MBW4700387.1 SMC-Scp complex subunit ScpB [Micromonospora sp. RL09-050-HVF-A]